MITKNGQPTRHRAKTNKTKRATQKGENDEEYGPPPQKNQRVNLGARER